MMTMTPIVAHGSGIDELAFVALPIVIFVTLQWLSRRKARREQDNRGPGTKNPDGQ
jgi:predicted esterase